MNNYALTFVSKDRQGIVAEVTNVLFHKGFNIADSSSTLLQGVFSMILIVHHKEKYTLDQLKSFFPESLQPSVYVIDSNGNGAKPEVDNYVISVYGADKPGIVHSIADKLYKSGINIIDLQTQSTGTPPKEVYIMVMEVLVPVSLGDSWMPSLKNAAKDIGTDITIRHIETYEL